MHLAKIKSIKYVGTQQAYNLNMASKQHNYLISPDIGQPIHANSHAVSYCIDAYWSAWLKVHFAPEWWASVMSGCHSDRIPRYMNTARIEGVKFGSIDIEDMTKDFSVSENFEITPGLIGIRGISKKAIELEKNSQKINNVDDFVKIHGKSKIIMEPLIKLGSFQKFHDNIKATWMWYLYKYCSGKEINEIKKEIRSQLSSDWTEQKIQSEIERQTIEFKKIHPKRKVPNIIINWRPKVDDSREKVMSLYNDDYTLQERLGFEKHYLGYYWHSPLDLYETKLNNSIASLKQSGEDNGTIECIIEKITIGSTKNGAKMGRILVSDGLTQCTIILWADQLEILQPYLKEGTGMRIVVNYNEARNSFTINKSTIPKKLALKKEYRNEK